MPRPPTLPTKTVYLANQIDILRECTICHDPFDDTDHAPARLTGEGSCHHVFGSSCLKIWMESEQPGANKCPYCRKVLFRREGEGDESDEESDYDEENDEEYDSELGYEGNGAGMLLAMGDPSESTDTSEDGEDEIPLRDALMTSALEENHDEAWSMEERRPSSTVVGNSDEDQEMNDVDGASDQGYQETDTQPISNPIRQPFFIPDYATTHDEPRLSGIYHYEQAKNVVKNIWTKLYEAITIHAIYEDDIEVRIQVAIMNTQLTVVDGRVAGKRWLICREHWPSVMTVGRDMVREHYKNGELVAFEGQLALRWIGEMGRALDWNLCSDEDNEGCASCLALV